MVFYLYHCDLDLGSSDHMNNPKLYLHANYLHTKFQWKWSLLSTVNKRKCFFFFFQFLALVTLTLILVAPYTFSNFVFLQSTYIDLLSSVEIGWSYLKLLSGNRFSIFGNSVLDFDPSNPIYYPKLCLYASYLYTKFCWNWSILVQVIEWKPKFDAARSHAQQHLPI